MGKSLVFILLLILHITTRADSDAGVTSCDACHAEATCLTLEERGNTPSSSLSCTCKEGFVGDGLSCYEVKECGSSLSCCTSGYKWSPKQGCVDVDECSLTPSPCGASQVCKNTEGSFECITTPLRGNAVQFRCENVACPQGMDCITVSGTSLCIDPCHLYTELNDDWRATDFRNIGKCDRDTEWQGWYRLFLKGVSARIPEKCLKKNLCGTASPIHMATRHPEPVNDIESHRVCGAYSSCSEFCHNIHVKNCYGQYYVYKLVKPITCDLAYCAEERPDSAFEVDQLICGVDKIQVSLNEVMAPTFGLDPLSGHLLDRTCTHTRVQNGVVWFEVEPRRGVCGNTRTSNDTHVTYTNSLFLYSPKNNSFNIPVSLPFSCAYPLEADATLNAALNPLLPAGGVVGSGGAQQASMSLYRDQSFTSSYPSGNVSLPMGQPLYVEVSIQENDLSAVNVLDNCYITYSKDPHDPVRHPFIQNKCPSDPQQASVIESGTSLRARFSALFFVPQGQLRTVYLHCHVSLCSAGPCVPNCSRRKRRFVSEAAAVKTITTIGPITWRK